MLVKVKRLDYDAAYTYAPPQVDAVVNTDDVVSAYPTEARGPGPFVLVNLRGGESMTIAGTVEQLLARAD